MDTLILLIQALTEPVPLFCIGGLVAFIVLHKVLLGN